MKKLSEISQELFIRLSNAVCRNRKYPLVSVITISYNKGDEIESTIKSVVNQTYPNVEYIVVDGGSKDGTVDVIKKYERDIAKWVSERDMGIYNAMNKGIAMSTGEWVMFINSGDAIYSTTTIQKMLNKVDPMTDILYGDLKVLQGDTSCKVPARPLHSIINQMSFGHPGTLIRSEIMKEELYDESYRCAADYDFFLKSYIKKRIFQYLPMETAIFEGLTVLSNNSVLIKSEVSRNHDVYNSLF